MKEDQRLVKLFRDLFDGDPWLDVQLLSTLEGINGQQASRRIAEGRNTIWEIVNHLTSWRQNILDRLNGKFIPAPEHNYMLPVEDTSEEAWQHAVGALKQSQEAWLEYLEKMQTEDLERTGDDRNKTPFYYYINGMLQHDAYHLGQIVLLAKLLK